MKVTETTTTEVEGMNIVNGINMVDVYKNTWDICLYKEEWRDIEKIEVVDRKGNVVKTYYFNKGDYQGSSYGRIRSCKFGKIKILHQWKNCAGYLKICLFDENSEKRNVLVSRVIATLFIENPENKPTVNHLNEKNITDNSVFNLAWATNKEQIHYGTHEERKSKNRKRRIIQCLPDGKEIATYDSATDAFLATGISVCNINNCCRGRQKSAGGYCWRYKNETEKNVCCFTLSGDFVEEFESIQKAAAFVGVHKTAVTFCLHGKTKTAGGYQFKWASDCLNRENIEPVSYEDNCKCVLQRSKTDGSVINRFSSLTEAAQAVGGKKCTISNCIQGRRKTAYGSFWELAPADNTQDMISENHGESAIYCERGRGRKYMEGQLAIASFFNYGE